MVLPNQRHLFDIPPGVVYLNCSYMSPLLKQVTTAGVTGLALRGSPWQLKTADWFEPGEKLRALFASLIKAATENVALIPSVSYGIAVAARNISLRAGQHIVVLDQQYPSNVYAWRRLSAETGATITTVKREPGQSWTTALLEEINDTTGLVAVPNCHWTDGSLIDLEVIGHKAKKVGAKFVVDASQSLGAYPLDIARIKPDFLVSVGYKWLMGPYGLGYFYCDSQYTQAGMAIEDGWLNRKGSEDFSALVDYRDEYKTGARRFDAGEFPDFVRIPMAIAALTQVGNWGIANIQETLSVLTNEIEHQARAAGHEISSTAERAGHMIGIRPPGDRVSEIARKLVANNVFVSFRGPSMRIAPHLYNSKEDVAKLFGAI